MNKTLPPLPLVDGCLFVDNSGWIEPISTCGRATAFRNLYGRIAAGEKAALNFGSAIHLALEYRYRNYVNRSVGQAYYDHIALMLTQFFEQHPTSADDWRTLNFAMEIIKHYSKRFEVEEFNQLADVEGKPLVELPFACPMFFYDLRSGETRDFAGDYSRAEGEILVIYSGRIDLPVSIEGNIYVLDFKTSSQLGSSFFDGKRMSSQPRGYAWAFGRTTGLPVHGYIIRGIRNKEIPQYVAAGKVFNAKGKKLSPEQWWMESFVEERYILKPGELDEWFQNTKALLEEFLWHYRRDYIPTRTGNEHACVNYGRCQYYEVCRLAKEDRLQLLHSGLFTQNTWSPLHDTTTNKK